MCFGISVFKRFFFFDNTSFIVDLMGEGYKTIEVDENLRLESPTVDSLRALSLARYKCSSSFQWHPGKWRCSFFAVR